MIVVEPFDVIDGLLTSSNIPEPDASVGEIVWSGGTLAKGIRRIVIATHKLYEVVAASTTDDPVTGAAKDVPTWVEVSYTNRYRMFDQVNSSQSTRVTPLTTTITSPKGFNSAAIFNATGVTSVRYQVRTAAGTTVYDKTVRSVDNSARVDYWHYFFSPIIQRYKFFVNDLPRAAGSRLTVTVNGAANVSVGTLLLGSSVNLGVACYGTSFKFVNLTKVDENDFGDLVLTPRRKYKLVDFDVRTDKSKLDFVVNKISELADKPCIWAGTSDTDDATVVYGYHTNYQQSIDNPVKCTATIQIRELA
jgi:hypothetical protein